MGAFTNRTENPMNTTEFATELVRQGWCVTSGCFPADRIAALAEAAREYWQNGNFYKAGIGRGVAHRVRPEIRGDHVLWLDECEAPAVRGFLADDVEALRLALNAAGYLGLHEFEGHFAVYPPGTRYARHYDRFRDSDARIVTITLYLNQNWDASDGGQLNLYPCAEPDQEISVLPMSGTMVGFLSADMLHEVLPSVRERFSLSGWFRKRP